MAAATSPLQELADAARSARKLRLIAEFDLTRRKRLHADVSSHLIRGTSRVWLTTYEVTTTRSNGRHFNAADAADAFRHLASSYPKATLLPDTIEVAVEDGPTTGAKLRPLVVRAWHEAFGLPVPSLKELADRNRARKAAKKATDGDRLALLKIGSAGVKEFNRLPGPERSGTDLREADLAGCRLDDAAFDGANLEGADLSGASLVGADFTGNPLPARLKRAKLVGADLTGANIPRCQGGDADFSRAVLKGACLTYGSYHRAKFVGADLTGAELTSSDLCGTDFDGARLDGADLDMCRFDGQTRWPNGFQVPAGLTWKGAGPDPRKAPTKKEKAGPKPTDTAGFLARLKRVTDRAKLDKAMAMLKADRFRLFARVTGGHVVGVVKSQSDPTLVYSCRLADDGTYACCTQNLNACGGLRGSPCKHLLVLIVGLVQAGELDPGTAHDWTRASRGRKPILDKDAMTETLLQYKGAEAGEVDWRPTETIPEDFYAM